MNVLSRYTISRGFSASFQCMKGHSKWDNTKDIKFAAMVSKTKTAVQLLSKLKKVIRAGGPDIKFNKELAQLQLEYRNANFSDEAFQKALRSAQQQPMKTAKLNVQGPSGSIIMIESEGLSQKKLQEFLITSFEKIGGEFYLTKNDHSRAFEDKGVVIVDEYKGNKTVSLDEMEEICIELDCDDVGSFLEDGKVFYEFNCVRNNLARLTETLEKRGFNVQYSFLDLRPLHPVEITKEDSEKIRQFYLTLRENQNITQVYANIRPGSIQVRPVRMKLAS